MEMKMRCEKRFSLMEKEDNDGKKPGTGCPGAIKLQYKKIVMPLLGKSAIIAKLF